MKAFVLAVLLVYPAIAEAHHQCVETSTVVGEQKCARFGFGWSGVQLSWELGGAVQWFHFDAIDREVDTTNGRIHVTSDRTPGTSNDLAFRAVYNLLDHFHLVTELSLGRLGNTPQLSMTPVSREMSPTSDDAHGFAMGSLLGAGVHAGHGGFVVGAEMAVGMHALLFQTARLPDTYFGQGGVTLEARVLASVWLSPHWTLGGLVSTNALGADERSVMLAVGVHAFPYDGSR